MLEQFVEPMLDNEANPIKTGVTFFKMDGDPDMRAQARLGSCSCCDFLAIGDDSILFVEETELLRSIERTKSQVDYLNDNDKEKFIQKEIVLENRAKVYGAMLVLCRLSQQSPDVKDVVGSKGHAFWLVVRGCISNEDAVYLDSLRGRLENSLRGQLGKRVIGAVKVLPLNELKEQLSSFS